MPVTSGDIVFYPGVRVSDEGDGGGPPRYWPLPDAVANNLLDDLTEDDAETTRVSVRKVYAGLVNVGDDGFASADAFMQERAAHADIDMVLFAHGTRPTVRNLTTSPYGAASLIARYSDMSRVDSVDFTTNTSGHSPGTVTLTTGAATINVGDGMEVIHAGAPIGFIYVSNIDGTGTAYGVATTTIDFEIVHQVYGSIMPLGATCRRVEPRFSTGVGVETTANVIAPKMVSVAALTADVSAAATEIEVDRVFARVNPTPIVTAAPTYGLELGVANSTGGLMPIFRRTGRVLITDGVDSEVAEVERVGFDGVLHLADPLTNGYLTGATVHGLIPLGEMVATADVLFSQRTWSRVFADTISGPSVDSLYDDATYPFAVSNAGAIEQRWAIVFHADPTEFSLIGETVGTIAEGNTATDFAPINPSTGTPYFTILAAGWQGDPEIANVLRFNTTPAVSPTPLWVVRSSNVAAFTAGADSATISVRGDDGTIGGCELPWNNQGTEEGGAGDAPEPPPSVGDEAPESPGLSPAGAVPTQATYRQVHTMTVTDEETDEVAASAGR
jgi:hypothetical protein